MTVIPEPIIDVDGITLPEYANTHEALREVFRGIYGPDIVISPDSQDGQLLAILALAYHDTFSVAKATYDSFSPSTAQGVGLSRVVKINGIRRKSPSLSTVDLRVVGQVGITVTGIVVRDDQQRRWLLPPLTIPLAGEITVTATAAEPGAWDAAPGTVTDIATPTRGLQSVENLSPSTPGAPIESDLALRQRQTVSTMIPSQTVLEGIIGAIASLSGVTRYAVYENDTHITDVNGIPPHSLAFIIDGGLDSEIATTIRDKKSPGVSTYGSVSATINDAYGIPHVVRWDRPTDIPLSVEVRLRAFSRYSTLIEDRIRASIVSWVNTRAIGEDILLSRLYSPANLTEPDTNTFEIMSLKVSIKPAVPILQDIVIAYNEAVTIAPSDVSIVIVP